MRTAQISASSRLLYPYHPLYGEQMEITGAIGGERDLIYVRLHDTTTRGLPTWMFDPELCDSVRMVEKPVVECAALLSLAALLDCWKTGKLARDETANQPTSPRSAKSAPPGRGAADSASVEPGSPAMRDPDLGAAPVGRSRRSGKKGGRR